MKKPKREATESVRIPKAIMVQVRALAEEQDRTVSAAISRLLLRQLSRRTA